MSAQKAWYPGLDGLRGVAFITIFYVHLPPGVIPILNGGYAGVDAFFVLSGFLITEIILREIRSTGRLDIRRFYLRRGVRLLPALLVFVGAVLVLSVLDPRVREAAGHLRLHALASLSYLYNWFGIAALHRGSDLRFMGHLWSLSVEEQFYLLWPPLIVGVHALARRRSRARDARAAIATDDGLGSARPVRGFEDGGLRLLIAIGVLLVVASNVARFLIGVTFEEPTSYFRAMWGTDVNTGPLVIGALVAMVKCSEPHWYARLVALSRVLVVPAVAAMVAFVVWMPAFPSTAPFRGMLLLFHLATAVTVVALVERVCPPLQWLAELRPLRWVGTISYGAYLFHFFLVWRLRDVVRVPGVTIMAATLLVSWVSFRFVERPVARHLRARWSLDAPVAPSAAVTSVAGPGVAGGSGSRVDAPPDAARQAMTVSVRDTGTPAGGRHEHDRQSDRRRLPANAEPAALLALVPFVLCICLAVLASSRTTLRYESSSVVLVTSGGQTSSVRINNNEKRLLQSSDVANLAAEAAGELSPYTVSANPDNDFLTITASAADGEHARRTAQAVAEAYIEYKGEQYVASLERSRRGITAQIDSLRRDVAALDRRIGTETDASLRASYEQERGALYGTIVSLTSDLSRCASPPTWSTPAPVSWRTRRCPSSRLVPVRSCTWHSARSSA